MMVMAVVRIVAHWHLYISHIPN